MDIENTLVIQDVASLQMWRHQLRTIMRPRNLPVAIFQLKKLSAEQNRSFSALARTLQRECGCAAGGFFMSCTVVVQGVWYFVSGNQFSDINFRHVLLLLVISSLAMFCGKVLGLVWARWRLLTLATSIHDMLIRVEQQTVMETI